MKRNYLWVTFVLILLAACQPATTTITASTSTPASVSTTSSFNPSIKIIGEPKVVFNWKTDHCDEHELVDLPARAIRMADDTIELYLSSTTSYRMTGADFDSLKPDCTPVFTSDFDRNPADYNYAEWMGAPYTLDGQTVYAIIHQEYHGDQAGSTWQANADFNSEQGFQNWSYQSWNGASYSDMKYNASKNVWAGPRSLCLISPVWMHPDLHCDPTLTWTSPITGKVTVNGNVHDLDPHGGNGVTAQIIKGNEELWSAIIENGDETGQSYNMEVDVQAGDQIHFRVNARDDTNWDTTYFDPGINIGPLPCPSKRHDLCTLISLTYAFSADGGATFTQPTIPNHLIATMPYQYDPDWMRSIWQPSNIVKNPNDDFYYALIQLDEHAMNGSVNTQGMCLMRTQTLDDPTSWRAWDGTGFNMQFIDPYVETTAKPEEHTYTLVSPEIGALTYGLSYNTYLEKFVAVGVGMEGFYFSVSDDLIHWSPRQFFMKAAQTFNPNAQPPYILYPTFIDPNSPSPSFDVTGQTAYLYFSRFNGSKAAIDTDLMRVEIEFSK